MLPAIIKEILSGYKTTDIILYKYKYKEHIGL